MHDADQKEMGLHEREKRDSSLYSIFQRWDSLGDQLENEVGHEIIKKANPLRTALTAFPAINIIKG